MREIKFRAWDDFNKIMIKVGIIDFEEKKLFVYADFWYGSADSLIQGSGETLDFDEVKLIEYTGLKDKNGVEIYEGDILKISNTKRFLGRNYKCYSDIEIIGGHVYVWTDPVIDGQRVRYGAKMLFDGLAKYIDMRGVATSDVEVVGNIYEDKELLRSEAE